MCKGTHCLFHLGASTAHVCLASSSSLYQFLSTHWSLVRGKAVRQSDDGIPDKWECVLKNPDGWKTDVQINTSDWK